MTFARTKHTVYPAATTKSFASARDVAKAYNYPLNFTGKGVKVGIIELGGGYSKTNLASYFSRIGVTTPQVMPVSVDGGTNTSDGPNGADGEVLLDIEVVGAIAPGAIINVYFAPNTDAGFIDAVKKATADGCQATSISWGAPENQWSKSAINAFSAALLEARQKGNVVFAAAGDAGSTDNTPSNVTDYPASDPNILGCGGTRLVVNSDGSRQSEVVWDDNDTSSATGGGVSKVFAGRQVPDIAGNADPETGYQVLVDGQNYVIGGTSAVAPLYAGLTALLVEASGGKLKVDLGNTLLTNLGVCFDVTSGDNGGYRAGPGRDNVTGLGVVDGAKLLAVLTDTVEDPAPVPPTDPEPPTDPTPPTDPEPPTDPDPLPPTDPTDPTTDDLCAAFKSWVAAHFH